MTAGNNGSGTPENDDPFAYLYRSEGGTGGGGGAAASQPGVPRTSYNQVRAVGERRYGGQQGQQQGPPRQHQQQAHQSSAHYAAPETVPGGRAAARREAAAAGPAGRGRGRNHNGLLVGALAVVAAVVLGVGAAIFFSDGDDANADQTGGVQAATAGAGDGGGDDGDDGDKGSDKNKNKEKEPGALPSEDAASLQLGGGATTDKAVQGAQSRSGAYVTGLDKPGSSATWTFEVPEDGKYTLFVGYGVPGKDANSTLAVNGTPRKDPLNMKNFAGAGEGEWEKGWTRTFAWVDLNKGSNTVSISCEEGNQCGFVLDRVWLKEGHVRG
ncbi:hypothetical protein [Streptomyces radiopugnans]|uniref:CBM6 domain-containing protein n=1 Tax=Streptomyces radiopugnans TaxID=403935 RepID=A0A1H9EK87_9ACTN|nr:hypothetical protein [Streptomyces radiopugnans]SEQ25653.1 hypothetical protein SAMN05216481_105152 [Streptomyces radiopugnans]